MAREFLSYEERKFIYHPLQHPPSDFDAMIQGGWYILHQKTIEHPDGTITLIFERELGVPNAP